MVMNAAVPDGTMVLLGIGLDVWDTVALAKVSGCKSLWSAKEWGREGGLCKSWLLEGGELWSMHSWAEGICIGRVVWEKLDIILSAKICRLSSAGMTDELVVKGWRTTECWISDCSWNEGPFRRKKIRSNSNRFQPHTFLYNSEILS